MSTRTWVALLFLAACGEPAGLGGRVVDVWGASVPGATVIVEGRDDRILADDRGRFSLPSLDGEFTLKVGAKGYIHDYLPVRPGADGPTSLLVKLYPKPETMGLYVVGPESYIPLVPARVERVGTELKSFQGLRGEPAALVEGSEVTTLFHTELRYSEVMRIGLELHRLRYVHQEEMPGPLGNAPATVNMWVSDGAVKLEIAPMRSRQDFLVTASNLTAGAYAFSTAGLLEVQSTASFDATPPEVRVAFPFELR